MKKKFSKIMMFLGVLSLVMGTITAFGTNVIYAQDLELIGKEIGLEISPSGTKLFDLSNLNPGDRKEAKIDIKNKYTSKFELFMRTERISNPPGVGQVDLFEQLIVTVYLDGEKIYTGPMKDYAISNISLGNFNPNVEKELKAVVHLPGSETGNEFQGKNVDVKWIFIATAEEPEDPREPENPDNPDEPEKPGESKESQEPKEPPKEIEIIEEETPMGVPELPEEEPVEEDPVLEDLVEEEIIEIVEDVPLGISNLPKTGEISPTIYYILGIVLLSLGIGSGAKKKIDKNKN